MKLNRTENGIRNIFLGSNKQICDAVLPVHNQNNFN